MAVGEGTPAPEEACKANERSWDLTFGSARPVWGAAGGLEPPHATTETRASSNEGAMCMADYTPATPASPGDGRKYARQIELDGFERRDARARRGVEGSRVDPPLRMPVEAERLERARGWIGEPVVRDAVPRVELALRHAVVARVARRDDLANPIGHDVDGAHVPRARETLATPSREVRPDDVVRR